MKKISKYIIASLLLGTASSANAQYYALSERLADIISTAVWSGLNYNGFVEVSALKGIGENNGDFIGISTSHGFKYSDWFFLGIGFSVDGLFTHVDSFYNGSPTQTKSGVVIPIFTDFRFYIGDKSNVSYFIGSKIGCSFLTSDSDIRVNRGYISSDESFYLKPSIGVRIPAGTRDHTAITISADYQLITPEYTQYGNYNDRSISLNGFGLSVGFEW